MADWFRRIKAALTPQVLLLLLLAFSMIGYCALREEVDGADRLEKQASAVLSRMEGAGRVEVTIMTRKAQTGGTGLMKGETGGEVPCGAMAVAQGADDPLVRMQLEQALCALLGLPNSAVSVVTGGKKKTKKAEKSIRKTIYRHPVGALRVFCSVMLLALLGVCGYAGSARTKNVPSAVSLPVIRTELEGDAIGGGSIAEVRARLNRQREEELALLDGVIADAGGDSAAKEAALAQKTQIAERMEREAQMTAVLEGMGAEGALAVCGAQGVTLLVPQTFGMDENARNRLLNAVGGSSGAETAQLKIILIKK